MTELTKAQEDVLKALWEVSEGAITDIMEVMKVPKPAYNTVATVVKVLEKKGYVTHKTFGKTNVYYPVVDRKAYANHVLRDTFKGLYKGSINQMASFFVKNKDISIKELEEMREILDREIKNQKK